MDHKTIRELCYRDRVESLKDIRIGWVKRHGFDLLAKYYIALANTIGPKRKDFCGYLFVDEINNNNMRNNLYATKRVFEKHGETVGSVSFYRRGDSTISLGYAKPIWEMCAVTLAFLPIVALALLGINQTKNTVNTLERRFSAFIRDSVRPKEIYLMTDHHFYSSVIAMTCPKLCSVIQHGLVMGVNFYYPIRAGRFLAWGEHTREIQHDDPAVTVTGTYKFDGIRPSPAAGQYRKIMYCVSSLDHEMVAGKIGILYELAKKRGMELLVKCHPGSFYDITPWKEQYSDVVFYKEELIQDLDFDLAVSENSTVLLDLATMNKPFIVFDQFGPYFQEYLDVIPHGTTEAEIARILDDIESIDFAAIDRIFRSRELNHGKCEIYESRRV